jgi:hypothetical protein
MKLSFIFQLIVALVALGFFVNGFLKFIRGERSQTFFKFLANSVVWLSVILFSLFPNMTHKFSEKLGFGESLNTFIFIGFLIVFIILFKIINILERTERNISEIVRKEALSKLEKSN